jgi:N-methylhydantoinase A
MTWRIAVDIGGTFTDLVAWRHSDHTMVRAKVLTVPDRPEVGVIQAVAKAGLPLAETREFVHGSTIAINAVLQGTGAKTALITTKGFRDVLEMGRKNRPDMYNLFFRPRICPVPRQYRLEVGERLHYTGSVIEPLSDGAVADALSALPPDIEALAICFLHSYANPAHENIAARVARETRPEMYISASTDLSGEAGEYERTCTAVVNAYVGPLVAGYITNLETQLANLGCVAPLLISQSNGGVMTSAVAAREPVRTMESGPAAGATGAAWLGKLLDSTELIAFDMGGTSAKACVIERSEPEMSAEYYIGGRAHGLPVQVPFLDIVEVGAGGGSIAHVDAGGALRVGPRSAGSVPGPACYDLGGVEPTVTDANIVAGRIDPDFFNGGDMKLRVDLAELAIERIADRLGIGVDECAHAIIRIANSIMAEAVRAVTVERGRDPRDFMLVAYGGAGPVHATAVARDLGIPRVLIPAGPGTFGAFGMLVTDLRHDVARTVSGRLLKSFDGAEAEVLFRSLESDAARYVRTQLDGDASAAIRFVRRLDVRYLGQFHPLTMTVPGGLLGDFAAEISAQFHRAHAERYGHSAPAEEIEVGALRVTAISEVSKPASERITKLPARAGFSPTRRRALRDDGSWDEVRVYSRDDVRSGQVVTGPAVVGDPATNIVLGSGDMATLVAGGHLMISVGGQAR